MAQEFFIKSTDLEAKIRQLLPSQGGLGAGQDLSASTMIMPIVDLTESAEGSNLRQDLQTAFSHTTTTEFNVFNTTTTVVNNTGYFRIFGNFNNYVANNANDIEFNINNGSTLKTVFRSRNNSTGFNENISGQYDFIIKLEAGDSLEITTNNADAIVTGALRQIADIDGNLINP